MKRMIAGFALALALSAGPAVADGMDKKAGAACCATANWTGLYIGGGIGGGAVVHKLTDGTDTIDGIGGEGFFGTAIIGYDRQVSSRWVLGIFADYDFSGITTNFDGTDVDHKHSWSVGGRAGVLSSPTTLWYGTAGYTEAKFTVTGLGSQDFQGYFLGAGVESQLGGGWSLRGEYRFTQFDGEITDIFGTTLDVEPSMHTVRAALSYKFGGRREEMRPLK